MLVAAALLGVLAVAGCGGSDFKNDPGPPVAAEVSAKISSQGVAVSPREFGAGLVNFTVANLTNETGSLAIHGPVEAASPDIAPGDTATVKVDVKTGSYEAGVDGFGARPFSFTVGPERGSGQNDLLLP